MSFMGMTCDVVTTQKRGRTHPFIPFSFLVLLQISVSFRFFGSRNIVELVFVLENESILV
jgi:hypothetical protein